MRIIKKSSIKMPCFFPESNCLLIGSLFLLAGIIIKD